VTAEERTFLQAHKAVPVRATGTRFGHTVEAQFPLGIALAALSLAKGALFPPADPSGVEIAMTAAPTQIVVLGTGHWRGEGIALVETVK
jgi:3-oxoacyl-[acyl-carrier-protein] synthase II